MSAPRRMFLLAGVAVVAAVLAGCGGDDGGEGTTGETATGATGGGGTAITIQGFAFDPATLQVSGETTLSISNEDGAAHTFTLDDGSVDQEIPAGESVEVTVNVSESTGFHCEIHRSMTGTLEVA